MLRIRSIEVGAFGRVHTGRRLVQQEQSWLGGQSACDLHQALRTIGQTGRG